MRFVRRSARATGDLLRLVFYGALGGVAGFAVYVLGHAALAVYEDPFGAFGAMPDVVERAVTELAVSQLVAVLMGTLVGLVTSRGSWRFGGILAFTGLVCVIVGFLAYGIGVALPQVDDDMVWMSVLLLSVEAFSLCMVVVYGFYGLDIAVRTRWRRSPDKVAFSRYFTPKVAFHVACFNEPPELVQASLAKLLALDYPKDRLVIMVLDDSTKEELRAPLEAWCRAHGLTYVHRKDRRGFKAGALNHALTLTPPDVDLISVLDADYQVEPDFLKETVGHFINPNLGFLQTPQDYRNVHQSFLTEQYYYADAYFYRAVLPSRNEENAIIFCGTMGIIRKGVLEGVGGWGEEFITEDSELSVRVLERGYESLFVNKTYGRGLIPPTFDAYKKQLYRWSFGSVKVIKAHLKEFLFSRMSVRQKFDFFIGNLHWFDGVWVCMIAALVALVGLSDLFGWHFANHHEKEIWLLGIVPVFLLFDGIVRLHLALRRSMGVGFGVSLRVMGMWYAIKFNNMFAAVKSLLGFKLPFVRTPKAPDAKPTRWKALGLASKLCTFELLCGLALVALGAASAVDAWNRFDVTGDMPWTKAILVMWIFQYALIFLIAPYYAYKSFTTFVPEHEMKVRRAPAGRPVPR